MNAEVDVRGRINQWNQDTYFAICSLCGHLEYSVLIDSKTKKKLRRKLSRKTDFVEKFYCVGLYYLINPHLSKLKRLKICRDIGKKKLLKYLKDYNFSSREYNNLKKEVKSVGKKSLAHKYLKRMSKKSVNLVLTYESILEKLK